MFCICIDNFSFFVSGRVGRRREEIHKGKDTDVFEQK